MRVLVISRLLPLLFAFSWLLTNTFVILSGVMAPVSPVFAASRLRGRPAGCAWPQR
ncbi:hypothetical protein K474DRAFT_1665579 [Panus rudis PR-1116 ss-1]|nr:hypothetical protein K474DRAFT_1665579 [Panus rudis PR-1116 ss-1]